MDRFVLFLLHITSFRNYAMNSEEKWLSGSGASLLSSLICVSLHRSTEPLSVRVRIAKSTVTCRMLTAFAVPGGLWPSRP